MVAKGLSIFLALALVTTAVPSVSFAATAGAASEDKAPPGPRKQLTTIIFSGIAGAILGLSTLSFYGRPQDKLSNIAVGFAIGIIGGAAYTTYKSATSPRDYYRNGEAHLWQDQENQRDPRTQQLCQTPKLAWSLTF